MRRSHDIPSPARLGITVHRLAGCLLQVFLLPANTPTLGGICIPRIGAFALSATCLHWHYFTTLCTNLNTFSVDLRLVQNASTCLSEGELRAIYLWRECSPRGSPVELEC